MGRKEGAGSLREWVDSQTSHPANWDSDAKGNEKTTKLEGNYDDMRASMEGKAQTLRSAIERARRPRNP